MTDVDTGYLFRARWPIANDTYTLSQLKVQAAGQIDAIAAEAGARIVGGVTYRLAADGAALIAEAPARPEQTPGGHTRHGLVRDQLDRIRHMAERQGLTDSQIAAVVGCTRSTISRARRNMGVNPGAGKRMAGAA
jgi:hypothetical protein